MWSGPFHGNFPPLTAWDLRSHFGSSKRVCFKSLAVGIYGPASPICLIARDVQCEGTALIKAYSDFIIRGLALGNKTHYANPRPLRKVVVTYMARRSTPQWPERKYCNGTSSFFACHYWDNFGERKLGRMIANERELVSRLQAFAMEPRNDTKQLVVNVADYNKLNFREQIAEDLRTDIMVGPLISVYCIYSH